MQSFEERFRREYPDCRVEVESVSSNLDRFHVYVGKLHCSDSGVRDLAFKWALQDVRSGKLVLPACPEQLRLWEIRE